MAKDKSLISVYVPQEVKERLEEWASEEDRSVSYIVGRLITEALETREQPEPLAQTEKPAKTKRRGRSSIEGGEPK
ncbi:MAG TPA: ribbon-helix-helix protein, CopG family [Coleofasciculaceae cyanobacterium]